MPTLYSQRAVPLAPNAAKPELSNNVGVAWDFTGHDTAKVEGEPWVFTGANKPTLVELGAGSQNLVTRAGEPGRQANGISNYEYSNTTDFGLQVGSGDFTVAIRYTTGPTLPTTTNNQILFRIQGSSGNALSATLFEHPSGWYITFAGSTSAPLGSASGAQFIPVNSAGMAFMQRINGVLRCYTMNSTAPSALTVRNGSGTVATTSMDSAWASKVVINLNPTAAVIDVALNAVKFWRRGLTDSELSALGQDFYSSESIAGATTAPGAPTIGTATAGNASASVTFTAPASDGGSAITGYTVTSSPGGITASGASSPINVTGLTNSTAYTFTVTATNSVGTSAPSASSNSVTPTAPAVTVTLTMKNRAGALAANLTNLRWAWWDETNLSLIGAPLLKGSAETTDASGVIVISLPGSTRIAGQSGLLAIYDSTGTNRYFGITAVA